MRNRIILMAAMMFFIPLLAQIPSDLPPPFPDDKNVHRRERMQNLYIWKLTEYLELTEEQSYQFFPRLRKFRKEEEERQKELRKVYRQGLEALQSDEKIDKKDFEKILNKTGQLEKEALEKRVSFIREQEDILTPEQQLKFLVFNERFKQQMRRMLMNHNK